jgi:hypothetical protein
MVSQKKNLRLAWMKKRGVWLKTNKRKYFNQRYKKSKVVYIPRSLGSLLLKVRVKPSVIKSHHFIIKCINRIIISSLLNKQQHW